MIVRLVSGGLERGVGVRVVSLEQKSGSSDPVEIFFFRRIFHCTGEGRPPRGKVIPSVGIGEVSIGFSSDLLGVVGSGISVVSRWEVNELLTGSGVL